MGFSMLLNPWMLVTAMATSPVIPLLDYQRAHVTNPARRTWLNWTRQGGKSFATSLRRVHRGIERRRNQIFLSAGKRQSAELMAKARDHIRTIEAAERMFELERRAGARGNDPADFLLDIGEQQIEFEEGYVYTQLTITLPIGIRIIGLPANPLTARGYTGDVLLDEFAMHKDDREIYAAVYASTMRNRGELDVCSTPKGCTNTFFRLAKNTAFSRSTVTIHDAVAQGLEVDIDDLRAGMPYDDLFRQEYDCEFLDEASSLLTYELITTCQDPQLDKQTDFAGLREAEGEIYAGVDVGRHRDLTVIWIGEEVGGVLWTRGAIELNKTQFREQEAIIRDVLRLPNLRRLCIDNTGMGMQIAENLARDFGPRAEPVTFTAAVKEAMAMELYRRFQDRAIRIPPDPDVANDLHSIRKTVTAAGNPRYEGERVKSLTGQDVISHADRFWAAALCVHAAADTSGEPYMALL